MYYNIKIKTRKSELSLDSDDRAITQREMDLYFAEIFEASDDFKKDIKKVEIKSDNLKSISDLEVEVQDEKIEPEKEASVPQESYIEQNDTKTDNEIEPLKDFSIKQDEPIQVEKIENVPPKEVSLIETEQIEPLQDINQSDVELVSIKNLKENPDIFGKINRKELYNSSIKSKKIDFETDIDALNSEIAILNAKKAVLEQKEVKQEQPIPEVTISGFEEFKIQTFNEPTSVVDTPSEAIPVSTPTPTIASVEKEVLSLRAFLSESNDDIRASKEKQSKDIIEETIKETIQEQNQSNTEVPLDFTSVEEIKNNNSFNEEIKLEPTIVQVPTVEINNIANPTTIETSQIPTQIEAIAADSEAIDNELLGIIPEKLTLEADNQEYISPKDEIMIDDRDLVFNGKTNTEINNTTSAPSVYENTNLDNNQNKLTNQEALDKLVSEVYPDNKDVDYSKFNNCDLNDIFSYDDSLQKTVSATPTPVTEGAIEAISSFVNPEDDATLPAVAAIPVQGSEIEQLPSIEEITKALEPANNETEPTVADIQTDLAEIDAKLNDTQDLVFAPSTAPIKQFDTNITFADFLNRYDCNNIYDEFLACAYYTKHVLNKNSFSIKSINAKLYQAREKIANMTVVNTLIEKEYIKILPDEDINLYSISNEGEIYFQNKLKF